MKSFAFASLIVLSAMTAAAAENLIEPGEWRVTSTTQINGVASPQQSKSRCITPDQAGNVAATFGPVAGTVNSTCQDPVLEIAGRKLTWSLQCRGQLDIDVTGVFDFDQPRHYTATVASKSRMAGTLVGDIKSDIEGERVGECSQ